MLIKAVSAPHAMPSFSPSCLRFPYGPHPREIRISLLIPQQSLMVTEDSMQEVPFVI